MHVASCICSRNLYFSSINVKKKLSSRNVYISFPKGTRFSKKRMLPRRRTREAHNNVPSMRTSPHRPNPRRQPRRPGVCGPGVRCDVLLAPHSLHQARATNAALRLNASAAHCLTHQWRQPQRQCCAVWSAERSSRAVAIGQLLMCHITLPPQG